MAKLLFASKFDYNAVQDLHRRYIIPKYPRFEKTLKLEQAKCIFSAMKGMDTINILPTGYGKTLAMIEPTLLMCEIEKKTYVHIIVTPLISLMQDMISRMKRQGLKCTTSESVTSDYIHQLTAQDAPADAHFILTSPEMLDSHQAREVLMKLPLSGLSVDEGHLVSLWSPSFRKSYGSIYTLRSFVKVPLSIFTATCTPMQYNDILNKTGARTENLEKLILSPNRPEIYLGVEEKQSNYESLMMVTEELNRKKSSTPKTIIFVNAVDQTTKILLWMRERLLDDGRVYVNGRLVGYLVEMYSGGTADSTKIRLGKDFVKSASITRVLICTVAFGMGVDCRGLKNCIIFDIPEDPSILMQEIGRIARTHERGICRILCPKSSVLPLVNSLKSGCVRKALLSCFVGGTGCETLSDDQSGDSCKQCLCCSFCHKNCVAHSSSQLPI